MSKMSDDSKACFVCRAREGRIFTPQEEEILAEICRIKEQFLMLNKQLGKLKKNGEDFTECIRLEWEIESLRKVRQELERKRIDAARYRMRLLGHE